MDNKNDLYNCCRWCKWFEKGCCTNEKAFGQSPTLNLYAFSENGNLSEAIKEGFKEVKFPELYQALLETKLSKKRIAELMATLASDIDSAIVNWTEEIDDTVSTALNNFAFDADADGIEIKDPTEFYCTYFW